MVQLCAVFVRFPRMRGDEPDLIRRGRESVKFSPHARG